MEILPKRVTWIAPYNAVTSKENPTSVAWQHDL